MWLFGPLAPDGPVLYCCLNCKGIRKEKELLQAEFCEKLRIYVSFMGIELL